MQRYASRGVLLWGEPIGIDQYRAGMLADYSVGGLYGDMLVGQVMALGIGWKLVSA